MSSITRKIYDIIQEYGSWENYQQSLNKDKMGQIQLEVGKTYEIRRHQGIVGSRYVKIVSETDYGVFKFKGDDGHMYDQNGFFDPELGLTPFDLVREVTVQTTKLE